MERLPLDLPQAFREASRVAVDAANDPDFVKGPGLPHLAATETLEHYFAIEVLGKERTPENRYALLGLLTRLHRAPQDIGFLPYALEESRERLTACFAVYRARPSATAATKCAVIAGWLSHYAADACQPLHATVHGQGRSTTGILLPGPSTLHSTVDGLLQNVPIDANRALAGLSVAAFAHPFTAIMERMTKANALVEDTFALQDDMPTEQFLQATVSDRVLRFTAARLRDAVQFTASLITTAWQDSATLTPPSWYFKTVEQAPVSTKH